MLSASLIHDHAFVMATALVEIISSCVRPEEEREAFTLFYEVCRSGIEEYELKAARIRRTITPSRN